MNKAAGNPATQQQLKKSHKELFPSFPTAWENSQVFKAFWNGTRWELNTFEGVLIPRGSAVTGKAPFLGPERWYFQRASSTEQKPWSQ